MRDNIGRKIKTLAEIGMYAGIVLSACLGILFLILGNGGIGLVLLVVLPIVFWLSSFPLYGFGELVEKVCNIEKHIQVSGENVEKAANSEQKTEVTINKGEVDPKRYICDSFIVTEKIASGKCLICMKNAEETKHCKIKNSIGTREIAVCQDCIAMFEKYNKQK